MIVEADIAEDGDFYILHATFVAPTRGWRDVSLSPRVYVIEPSDGLQGVDIVATPPNGPALRAIELFPLEIRLPKASWIDGFRIFAPNGTSLRLYGTKTGDEPYKDSVRVNSAAYRKDKLSLGVSYSGGCADHKFRLTQRGGLMKSIPPQIVLEVTEDDNDDACRMLIEEILQFDLSGMDTIKAQPHLIVHIANSSLPPLEINASNH